MKIAMVLFAKQVGGHEIMSLNLASMISKNPNVELILYYNDALGELFNSERHSATYSALPYKDRYFKGKSGLVIEFLQSTISRFRLIKNVKKQEAVVINCQGSFEQNWIVTFLCFIFNIDIITYVPYTSLPSDRNARWPWLRDLWQMLLVKLNDKFIVIHEDYKLDLIERYNISEQKIIVAENQRVRKIFPVKVRKKSCKRLKFILPGRIYFRQKGQDLFCNAVHELRQLKIPLSYEIIGSGPDSSRLESDIKELNLEEQIKIKSWTNSADDIYGSADCVILPSRYEGVSLVLLEAIISNIPIIASNITIHRSFLKEEFLFDLNDPSDLAKKILYVTEIMHEGCWRPDINYNRSLCTNSTGLYNDLNRYLFND